MSNSLDTAFIKQFEREVHEAMAITWSAQMLALAYTIVALPDQAAGILNSMEALGLIWSVGLSVLGIYVYKRSEEKRKNS